MGKIIDLEQYRIERSSPQITQEHIDAYYEGLCLLEEQREWRLKGVFSSSGMDRVRKGDLFRNLEE